MKMLQNWKKRGCLAERQFLCSSIAALWWVSAPLALQHAFQTLWRAWNGSSISPAPAGGTRLAHSRCTSGIYSAPCFFWLTPTLIRVVLGLFCTSGLRSHTDSWKTLLSGFAFLLQSDTSKVWKEGSARSGSPVPCHMETLFFRVLVQDSEELPLPLRQRSTAEERCWAEKLPEIHVQHAPCTQYDCFVSH